MLKVSHLCEHELDVQQVFVAVESNFDGAYYFVGRDLVCFLILLMQLPPLVLQFRYLLFGQVLYDA